MILFPKTIATLIYRMVCIVLMVLSGNGICYLQAQSPVKLYHCMVDLEDPQKNVMKKYNIEAAVLIDGRYIDPKNTGYIDSVSFAKAILTFFPGPADGGLGLLDLEDENYKSLRNEGRSKVPISVALEQFIKMVRIAKNLRPNVKWSVYNIPYTTYYDKTENWKSQQTFLDPLLKELDIFTPSLYDFYPASVDWADDKAYFTENIKIALELGHLYNKPVMPYIWNRWHDSNAKSGLLLIDENEFEQDMRWIIQSRFENTAVTGLIWFDAHTDFYRIKPELKKQDNLKVGARENQTSVKVFDRYARLLTDIANN